jgi:hypothetical protein
MNDVQNPTAPSESTKRVCGSLLATLTSVGSTWAAYGLKVGKMALTTGAETLGKTAEALDTLAVELEKRAAAPVDAPPAEEATHAGPPAPAMHVDAPAS